MWSRRTRKCRTVRVARARVSDHSAAGKDFDTYLTYVLQGTSPTSSKLTVTAEMRFTKSPLIKGMILRGAKVRGWRGACVW